MRPGIAAGTLVAALAFAPIGSAGQEEPPKPPPPSEVTWPEPEKPSGPLPPLAENRSNTPAKALAEALFWLARHQSDDGAWHPREFAKCCAERECPGAGNEDYAVGVTGLAALAFLRAGVLPGAEGTGAGVGRALGFLAAAQGEDGCLGEKKGKHYVYGHAIGTLALCEAYGRTRDFALGSTARKALDWIRQAQNPYLAWRYGVRPQDNDTSVTGWMVQALRVGADAGLEVEPRVFDGALAWCMKVTDPEYGRAGYLVRGEGPARPPELADRYPKDRSEAMTAATVFMRLLCGADRKDEMVAKGFDLMLRCAPVWDPPSGSIDFYYWYYGTEATARFEREPWRKWSRAVEAAVVPWQRGEKDGCARGSWDPVDPWQKEGGRVYMTALGALMLDRLAPKK